VIVYYYHTDAEGLYSPGPGDHPQARRHGHLRGWIKTDENGQYAIYTIKPASYPNSTIESHIHLIIKEPDLDLPYWIDDLVFTDDPFLTPAMRQRRENRGGSGILETRLENGLLLARHDIILGLNVPGYPKS
jgi:protocatechuate 3,4-dioxygenase beta subunit